MNLDNETNFDELKSQMKEELKLIENVSKAVEELQTFRNKHYPRKPDVDNGIFSGIKVKTLAEQYCENRDNYIMEVNLNELENNINSEVYNVSKLNLPDNTRSPQEEYVDTLFKNITNPELTIKNDKLEPYGLEEEILNYESTKKINSQT